MIHFQSFVIEHPDHTHYVEQGVNSRTGNTITVSLSKGNLFASILAGTDLILTISRDPNQTRIRIKTHIDHMVEMDELGAILDIIETTTEGE